MRILPVNRLTIKVETFRYQLRGLFAFGIMSPAEMQGSAVRRYKNALIGDELAAIAVKSEGH